MTSDDNAKNYRYEAQKILLKAKGGPKHYENEITAIAEALELRDKELADLRRERDESVRLLGVADDENKRLDKELDASQADLGFAQATINLHLETIEKYKAERERLKIDLSGKTFSCQNCVALEASLSGMRGAIESEPELTDPMPDEAWEKIKSDRNYAERLFSAVVKTTKQNILKKAAISSTPPRSCEHDQDRDFWTATKKGQTMNVSKSVCDECPYCKTDDKWTRLLEAARKVFKQSDQDQTLIELYDVLALFDAGEK